jgi:hypothetical protein
MRYVDLDTILSHEKKSDRRTNASKPNRIITLIPTLTALLSHPTLTLS